MDIDRAVDHKNVISPNSSEKIFPGNHPTRITSKVEKDFKFLAGENELSSLQFDLVRLRIDFKRTDANDSLGIRHFDSFL